MNWKRTRPWLTAASLGFGLAGCGVEAPEPGTETPVSLRPENVRVTNDTAALEARVTRLDLPLTVAPKTLPAADVTEKQSEQQLGVRLRLVAEISPPMVNGVLVQANDIEIDGHLALVTYNVAGDVFAGAVQVIDFGQASRPQLMSEVAYLQADANAVAVQGSDVFVGLASADPQLFSPAMVEELHYSGGLGLERTGEWLDVPSYSVTDLAVRGEDLVATVGALGGGVVRIAHHDLSMARFLPLADVRGVTVGGNDIVSVCGGASPRMVAHDPVTLAPTLEIPIVGFSAEFAKGTVEYSSSRCYLGTGDAGFQVRSTAGDLLAQLAEDAFTENDEAVVVNAVSVDRHLGFVAAGPAGVQVVRLGRYRCDGREAEETEGLRLLGELVLEDGASCNMIKVRNNVLVVAAGSGGVKIVTMEFLD